jgi:hypothetical protein
MTRRARPALVVTEHGSPKYTPALYALLARDFARWQAERARITQQEEHMQGKAQIKAYMRTVVGDYVDRDTNEVNTTGLAEAAAHEAGHSEWLDDDQHIVWDCAVEVGTAHERALRRTLPASVAGIVNSRGSDWF